MIPRNKTAAIVLASALGGLMSHAGPADRTLDVYWNDVEGGGATLIVTPAGQSVLIDAGSPGDRDAGRILEVARLAGLKRIDYLIVTHFHLDHFGGAANLAALVPIGQVYDNGIPEHDPDHAPSDSFWVMSSQPYRRFVDGRHNLVSPGLVLPLLQAAGAAPIRLRCVASRQRFVDPPTGAGANPLAGENSVKALDLTDNDNSSAWVLDFGPFRFWDGGDLTWNMEAAVVLPVNRVGEVDVYQVDHHGLAFSNNPVLIHSLAPTVSAMNNGSKKGTAKSTVEALRSSPGILAMYQLHKNLRKEDPEDNTGDEYIANFSGDMGHKDAHYIKMSVDPTGAWYTISIPASGFSRRYQTRLNKP